MLKKNFSIAFKKKQLNNTIFDQFDLCNLKCQTHDSGHEIQWV